MIIVKLSTGYILERAFDGKSHKKGLCVSVINNSPNDIFIANIHFKNTREQSFFLVCVKRFIENIVRKESEVVNWFEINDICTDLEIQAVVVLTSKETYCSEFIQHVL
jgi:hypothetical protein